jgi:N-acetylmuramoyl-L-alanine amidase
MHHFNRFYLLISIIVSLVIPFLTFEIIKIVPVFQNFEPLNTVVTSSAIPENEIQENFILKEENTNLMPYILWSLYGMISFLLFLRFGKNSWKLISKSKSNPIVKFKKANLILVEEKTMPYTFFNSIFINVDDYNNRNIEDELYSHELVHVNQKHTVDILFIEFLRVIFWFNPLLIFYKKAIQLNHEFLADEEIVKTYNNVPFYQNLLLQKCSNVQTIYLASNLNYSVTKRRLLMMTKNTSKKIAVLKKIAIVPILAVLIYFFCIEVVAQEKIINVNSEIKNSEIKNSEITDTDRIRDSYYSNVRIILKDLRANISIDKMYEELTLEEKRGYLSWIPDIKIEKEIPVELFEKMKTKNMAIWINGKASGIEEIQEFKRTDFSYYTYSFIHKNARTKRFPQEYQYRLYTKKYFDENLKNSHLHFSNDTLKMVLSNYDKATKKVSEKVSKKTATATVVRETIGKEGYNLYEKEKKEKKIVVIDVGHGGHDFGATKDEWNEKTLISEIAKKIKEMHSDSNVEIHFTRSNDEFVTLNDRTNLINNLKPDLVISLHLNNSKNAYTSGFEVFISNKTDFLDKTKELAEILSSKLSKTQLKNRGLKTAPFWILKNSDCPSMVVELGFISNENDRNFIASEKGQFEIAKYIVAFISEVK